MVKIDLLKDTHFVAPIHLSQQLVNAMVPMEQHIPISVPTIRAILSPRDVYKDCLFNSGLVEADRPKNGSIHRQLSTNVQFKEGDSPPSPVNNTQSFGQLNQALFFFFSCSHFRLFVLLKIDDSSFSILNHILLTATQCS